MAAGSADNRPVLVTGATGFVGRHVSEELARRAWPFVAMVRSPGRARRHLGPDVDLRIGTIEDADACRRAVAGSRVVLHLAAAADVSDLRVNERVNLQGLATLLAACREEGIERFVFVSSTCAGRRHRDAYGETKRRGEELVKASGLDFVILRPTMIYGRGSKEFDLFARVVGGCPLVPLIGTGQNVIQPVYLGDAVQVLVDIAGGNGTILATYDLAGPEPVTFDDFVQLVAAALGRSRRRIVHIPAKPILMGARWLGRVMTHVPLTVDQVMAFLQDTQVDVEPLRRDVGFMPRSIADGLSAALNRRDRGWEPR